MAMNKPAALRLINAVIVLLLGIACLVTAMVGFDILSSGSIPRLWKAVDYLSLLALVANGIITVGNLTRPPG